MVCTYNKPHTFIKLYAFIFFSFITSAGLHAASIPMLFTGAIQFPKQVQHIPSIIIYSLLGCKVPSAVDSHNHRLTYTINRPRDVQHFWLLITKNLIPVPYAGSTEHSTLQGWRVDTAQPYKFYGLTRVVEESPQSDTATITSRIRWEIQSHDLAPFHGQLPDDTIIIYYDPVLIADVRGGSPFELPTIVMNNDLISTVGSEALLHELSGKLSIAALELRHFFTPEVEYAIRETAQAKTIMTLSAT